MEVIEAIDIGAYRHFHHQLGKQPELQPIMEIGYYLSNYIAVGILFSLVALLFLLQGRRQSARVTAISLAFALTLLFAVRFLVRRMRPPDGENWLGPNDMEGSYPSGGVFLFMLAMIFLGFAIWNWARRPWQRGLYVLTATLLTVWVCLSQLFLSVHYVTDIIGAMAAATFVGWVASRFLDRAVVSGNVDNK